MVLFSRDEGVSSIPALFSGIAWMGFPRLIGNMARGTDYDIFRGVLAAVVVMAGAALSWQPHFTEIWGVAYSFARVDGVRGAPMEHLSDPVCCGIFDLPGS